MKYSVLTFGCRVNQAESLAMERELAGRGGVPVPAAEADVVLVNSCSVTATADQGTRQAIRRVARDNPDARIVVTGCYATRRPDDLRGLPGVVRIVPNGRKDTIVADLADGDAGLPTTADRYAGEQGPCGAPELDASAEAMPPALVVRGAGLQPRSRDPLSESAAAVLEAQPAVSFGRAGDWRASGVPVQLLAPGMGGRTAFTLRVQTGCDEGCTYCIIPSTRGRARSTPVDDVVRELQRIEASGYREVTLTGVHLGAYGRDLSSTSSLSALLLRAIQGTDRLLFRLGSLEPMDCSRGIVDLASASGRIAPAFHLPLQHASTRMLNAMGRPYTIGAYAALVDAIRARLPHASIGADVIVGFPGETEEDARLLREYLESSPLTHLHVFPYSDRPGTPASRMQPKVHGTAVRERAAAVRAVGRALSARFERSLAGRIRPGLTIDDGATVLIDNGLKVRVAAWRTASALRERGAAGLERNRRVRVRLDVDETGLRGEVTGIDD